MSEDTTPVIIHLDQTSSSTFINSLLKTKLRTKSEKAFSMNFTATKQFPLPKTSYTSDFKISYRFDCFLLCFDDGILILDRMSKNIRKCIYLERPNFVTLTLDDDYNEIYLMYEDKGYFLEKYELSSFLNERMECLWSVYHTFSNPYGMIPFNMVNNMGRNSRIVIVCEFSSESGLVGINCGTGNVEPIDMEVSSCSSIQLGLKNEFIAIGHGVESAIINLIECENGKFKSISQPFTTSDIFSFRSHSLLYDRVSDLIYFTDYLEGSVYIFKKCGLKPVTTLNCFPGMLSAMCLDQLSGEFLVFRDGVLHVFE